MPDLLRNVHLQLEHHNVRAGIEVAMVRGDYLWYHYLCDGFDDVGVADERETQNLAIAQLRDDALQQPTVPVFSPKKTPSDLDGDSPASELETARKEETSKSMSGN